MNLRQRNSCSNSEKGKRTNSLGLARTDCHTCSSANQACDRQRPQCTTCLAQRRKCGGFATPLSWDNSRIWLSESELNSASEQPTAIERADASGPPGSRAKFRFVNGASMVRKRRRIRGPSGANANRSRLTDETPQDRNVQQQRTTAIHDNSSIGYREVQPGSPFIYFSSGDISGAGFELVDGPSLFDCGDTFQDLRSLGFAGIGTEMIGPLDAGSTSNGENGNAGVARVPGAATPDAGNIFNEDLSFSTSDAPLSETLITSVLRTPTPDIRIPLDEALSGNLQESLLKMCKSSSTTPDDELHTPAYADSNRRLGILCIAVDLGYGIEPISVSSGCL